MNDATRPAAALRPMLLQPLAMAKVWGGAALAARVGLVHDHRRIGEVWLAHDGSIVASGMHAGARLIDVVAGAPDAVVGRCVARVGRPVFPVIAKLLHTTEWLSVQVHPDDAAADALEGQPFGKPEVWYVLDAAPGAAVLHGVVRAVTRDEVAAAVRSETIVDLLHRQPVGAGDVLYNAPGVIHALGPGIVLFELQQASDITYRLYDWGRGGKAGRALHVDQALAVATLAPETRHVIAPPAAADDRGGRRRPLFACPAFALEAVDLDSATGDDTEGWSFHVLHGLRGRVTLRPDGDDGTALPFAAGQTALIPAACGAYRVTAEGGRAAYLKSWLPR